jgi:hypothetical protein
MYYNKAHLWNCVNEVGELHPKFHLMSKISHCATFFVLTFQLLIGARPNSYSNNSFALKTVTKMALQSEKNLVLESI